jgi:hypothetical protein
MHSIRDLANWMDWLSAKRVRAVPLNFVKVCRLGAAASLFLYLTMAAGVSLAQRPAADDFFIAITAVEQYFESLADYQAGDLITQSQIAAAVDRVADAGAELPDADRLVERGLADNSFLARQLSTPAGRKFMRKVARQRGGFSRLDQLSSISSGQSIVRDLIRERGGDKLIEYLTTTRGGRKLGGTLAGGRHGADLNKPTGRIYTAEDLIVELKRTYAGTTDTAQDEPAL